MYDLIRRCILKVVRQRGSCSLPLDHALMWLRAHGTSSGALSTDGLAAGCQSRSPCTANAHLPLWPRFRDFRCGVEARDGRRGGDGQRQGGQLRRTAHPQMSRRTTVSQGVDQ